MNGECTHMTMLEEWTRRLSTAVRNVPAITAIWIGMEQKRCEARVRFDYMDPGYFDAVNSVREAMEPTRDRTLNEPCVVTESTHRGEYETGEDASWRESHAGAWYRLVAQVPCTCSVHGLSRKEEYLRDEYVMDHYLNRK